MSASRFPFRLGGDLSFRVFTGFFALLLVAIVLAIGVELWRNSLLSIQKFGVNFWVTRIWDPVAGDFGALPFIWGTLYSALLALLLSTPVAMGIAIFLSELSPGWARQPLVFLTELLAAIPSIVESSARSPRRTTGWSSARTTRRVMSS